VTAAGKDEDKIDDCLVCREITGEIEVPGGFVLENDELVAFHLPPLNSVTGTTRPYLGHLLIVTRRHVAALSSLTPDESAAVGRAASRVSLALTSAAGAEWVYAAVIGTAVPHFHLHLLPRYPGTPEGVLWYEVDEWEGSVHGDASEVGELAARIRDSLCSSDLVLDDRSSKPPVSPY